MKHTHLFVLLCLLAGLFSCNEPDDEIVLPIAKIKQTTSYFNNNEVSQQFYTYNAEGKLTLITGNNGYSETYTYEPGKITRSIKNSGNPDADTTIFNLNSQGLMVTIVGSDESFVYDKAGYLTKYIDNLVSYFTIDKGNTVKRVVWRAANGTSNAIYDSDYAFLTDKLNTIGNENKGMTWLGKQNKNLVSREDYYDMERQIEITFDYSYEFDDQNRVIKSTSTYNPNHYTTYTYYE